MRRYSFARIVRKQVLSVVPCSSWIKDSVDGPANAVLGRFGVRIGDPLIPRRQHNLMRIHENPVSSFRCETTCMVDPRLCPR